MKNITKFFAIAVVILGFSANAFGQPASAIANATLVSAITIGDGTPLNFGSIVAGAAGTVSLSGVENTVRTHPGVVTPTGGGSYSSAAFTVGGTSGLHYAVTLPSSLSIVHSVTPANTMTVDAFTCDVAVEGASALGTTAHGILAAASRTFYVGATLNVESNDIAGAYAGTFNVSVVYE